jgi:phosphoenolpyruvate---glycerone phosphotransferase subunit DhaL
VADGFKNKDGKVIVERMIAVIHENRAYLSEIDGAIGDGDHGINMDKGFTLVEREIEGEDLSMSDALKTLGRTLVMEIGGSMGPLYGSMFRRMARASKDDETVTAETLRKMMDAATESIRELGDAKPGDKTLVDALDPATKAASAAAERGASLPEAIDEIVAAAERGWKSTEDMVAKIGRSARLGERSRGTLDAGATSCYLLLQSMGETMKELASAEQGTER